MRLWRGLLTRGLVAGVLLAGCVDPKVSGAQDNLTDAISRVAQVPEVGLTSDGPHQECVLNIDCTDPAVSVLYERLSSDRTTCQAVAGLLPLVSDTVRTAWAVRGQAQFLDPDVRLGSQLDDPSPDLMVHSCLQAAERNLGFLAFAPLDVDARESAYARLVVYFEAPEFRTVRDRIRLSYKVASST
jgi:hypothetical protein